MFLRSTLLVLNPLFNRLLNVVFRSGSKTVEQSSEKCSAKWWLRMLSSHSPICWIVHQLESLHFRKDSKVYLARPDSTVPREAIATTLWTPASQVLRNRVLSTRKFLNDSIWKVFIAKKLLANLPFNCWISSEGKKTTPNVSSNWIWVTQFPARSVFPKYDFWHFKGIVVCLPI